LKKAFNILIWIILIAGIISAVVYFRLIQNESVCKNVLIKIEKNKNDGQYVTEDEISSLFNNSKDSIIGKKLNEIDLEKIEDKIKINPYVAEAEIFSSFGGNLKIKIIQRQALIRIINSKGQNFYIATDGEIIPVKTGVSSRVIVANGDIKKKYSNPFQIFYSGNNKDETVLLKLYKLAKYIKSDKFLNATIEQIYVNNPCEFELIPKTGKHFIEFGDTNNMKKKFDNLIVFYKDGLKRVGWDKYKKVNLKYLNQVVCSK